MTFASTDLVRRIEAAEARSLELVVRASGAGTVVRPVGGGIALFRGEGSPFNKVVGLGFAPLTAPEVVELEQLYVGRDAAIQIEIATHADPTVTNLLVARSYQLTGFENVFGQALGPSAGALQPPPGVIVRRAGEHEREAWIEVLTAGFSELAPGEQAAAHDDFDRAALERVFRDVSDKPSIDHWLALEGERILGGASMTIRAGIAQLSGAATHPTARRRGVQSALLASRLAAAREAGCELAVLTTQPGSKSHENALRAGFGLLYARAVWQRELT